MEEKMKYQLIIDTPLGIHKTVPSEMSDDNYDELVLFVKQITDSELDSITFADINGDEVFLSKKILLNSVIKIKKS